MLGVTVIILHAFVAQATTKEDPVDQVAAMMLDKLVDKLMDRVTESPVQHADVDGATLGKAQPNVGRTPTMMQAQPVIPSTVSMAQAKLRAHGINPGPLETLALTAIDANNRGTGMRNVAVMAMHMPSETRAQLSKLGKEVVVKAEAIKKEDMAGITAPMNFFDPMKFTTDISGEQLVFFREAELKHGRIGMLASLGFIAGEMFSPIFGAPADLGPATSLFLKAVPSGYDSFWGAAIVSVAFAELCLLNEQQWNDALTEPGDFNWDPLGLKPKDAKNLRELQNKELNNGRLAMLAAAGIIAQEMVTGEKIFR